MESGERVRDTVEDTPVGTICSFCGTVGVSESGSASGLGVVMCSACLERFHQDAQEDDPGSPPGPWWADMAADEVLATIPKITAVQAQVDDFLHRWVRLARERGHTWADIGGILGVSRQAAWQRFHTPGD